MRKFMADLFLYLGLSGLGVLLTPFVLSEQLRRGNPTVLLLAAGGFVASLLAGVLLRRRMTQST